MNTETKVRSCGTCEYSYENNLEAITPGDCLDRAGVCNDYDKWKPMPEEAKPKPVMPRLTCVTCKYQSESSAMFFNDSIGSCCLSGSAVKEGDSCEKWEPKNNITDDQKSRGYDEESEARPIIEGVAIGSDLWHQIRCDTCGDLECKKFDGYVPGRDPVPDHLCWIPESISEEKEGVKHDAKPDTTRICQNCVSFSNNNTLTCKEHGWEVKQHDAACHGFRPKRKYDESGKVDTGGMVAEVIIDGEGKHKNIGESFDSFLEEEGILEDRCQLCRHAVYINPEEKLYCPKGHQYVDFTDCCDGFIPSSPDILKEAHDIINGERQDQYGAPEDSFGIIASFWHEYLFYKAKEGKFSITPLDVAHLMTLFKIARMLGQGNKRDNYIDAIGYLAIGADRILEGE